MKLNHFSHWAPVEHFTLLMVSLLSKQIEAKKKKERKLNLLINFEILFGSNK